jgi:hypothetical protein
MLSVEDMERIKGLNIEDGGTVQFTDPAFVNFILTAFG